MAENSLAAVTMDYGSKIFFLSNTGFELCNVYRY